jgi:hypothetical protein
MAGLLALTAASNAAAPTRHKVAKSVTIAAPPAKVWAIIRNFDDLTWVSVVKSSTATEASKPGSVRTLDLGGPKLVERLTKYNDQGMSYSYVITDDPANLKVVPAAHYRSAITVKATANGGSTVTWRGSFTRASPDANPPAGMDDASAVKAVTGIYTGGLADLKKKAEAS